MSDKREIAQEFVNALQRQIERKALFTDGIDHEQNPRDLIISIAEELGEVSTEFARQRIYGAVEECIDVASSALLLAILLDPTGDVLKRVGNKWE